MGEDYMRLTRVLISSCMKGTRLEDVNRKSAKFFLRAMDLTNRQEYFFTTICIGFFNEPPS